MIQIDTSELEKRLNQIESKIDSIIEALKVSKNPVPEPIIIPEKKTDFRG